VKHILCATLDGLDASLVDVEVSFVRALPSFSIVGLAQTSIQESKERIKSALSSVEFKFPPQKVTVNLSPSDLVKKGSHFDLPIALLIALQKSSIKFDEFIAFGELGLDGRLKDTVSIFPIILSLVDKIRDKKIIVPRDSFKKVSKIPELRFIVVDTLKEALDSFLDNTLEVKNSSSEIESKSILIGNKKFYYLEHFNEDFIDIKGQTRAKRASLICAAGMHNILYEGSPGCGKSMSAKRLPYILPPMELSEILHRAKLDSLQGIEPNFRAVRESRSPHHSASRASVYGGGSINSKIGEVALAHNGILFFDELPHFGKSILEALREPLQDYRVLVSRVNSKVKYDTKFLFIGAMNPCPCGNFLSQTKECRCSDLEIKRYKSRLSSAVLDRVELYVQMQEVSTTDKPTISSKEMFDKVLKAFIRQKKRGQSAINGKLSDEEISRYCHIKDDLQTILDSAIMRFGLSQRAINNTLKVARTIADIEDSETIEKSHLLEALSFRMRHHEESI
jgi:magnesium chelatase family protein